MVATLPHCHRRALISWTGWEDDSDVVAMVAVRRDGSGNVWYNMRLAVGRRLSYIDGWARNAVDRERPFDAIRLKDLVDHGL